MCETMAVRRKDNGKLKILCVENFDPAKHELLDAQKVDAVVVEKPKRGRKPKE